MRAIGLASVLVLGVTACGRPEDPRGVGHDEVLLQVSAIGRAESRPDQARFTAGVQTIGSTAAEASARNSQTINRVVAELARLGVAKDDIQTRSITLARIDYGPNRGRFEANNMIEVRVRDIAKAGDAIAATTQAGANVLSGPNLGVGDPEKPARMAYANAYRVARARADAYAEAAGMKVARVLAVREADAMEGPIGYGPPGIEARDAVAQTATPPPVEAGVSTRTVQIRADFALAR